MPSKKETLSLEVKTCFGIFCYYPGLLNAERELKKIEKKNKPPKKIPKCSYYRFATQKKTTLPDGTVLESDWKKDEVMYYPNAEVISRKEFLKTYPRKNAQFHNIYETIKNGSWKKIIKDQLGTYTALEYANLQIVLPAKK